MAVEDLDGEAAQQLQSRAAKKNVSLGVVGIVSLGGSVERLAIVERVGANEMNGDVFSETALQHRSLHPPVRERDRDVSRRIGEFKVTLEHGPVSGQDEAERMAAT